MKTTSFAAIAALVWILLARAGMAQDQTVTAHFDVVQESGSGGKPPDSSNVVVWLSPVGPAPESKPVSSEAHLPRLVQKNKMFHPHVLVVTAGSIVEFPNRDPFFHNVFSLFEGKRFDLGLYEAGGSRVVHFDRPGVCYIFCNIHPEMSAVVVVVDAPYYGMSDKSGEVSIPGVPPGQYVLHVWYEGALPEQLKSLSRQLTISETSHALGTLRLLQVNGLQVSHKNKYGQDYDRPAPDNPAYTPQ